MKNLLITLFLILFSLSVFAEEDVNALLNSTDIMQKKMGLRYAQKDKKYEDKVIEILNSESENLEVKMIAARTLGVYKDEKSMIVLLDVLKSSTEEDLQSSVLSSLSKYDNNEKAVNAIIDILKNGKTEYIRSVAVQTLKYIKTEAVFNAFLEALDDDSALVRRKVTIALGELGNKKAIPALKKVVKTDEDNQVKANAQSSLYKLGVKNENLKSTSTALLLGITPINGLGLWYSGETMLAITNFVLEGAAVGMILYGYDGFNDMNKDNKLVNPGKHYAFIGGATMFLIGYVWDIVMPVMSVSAQNDKEKTTAFKPIFFTNGEATVVGFSFDF